MGLEGHKIRFTAMQFESELGEQKLWQLTDNLEEFDDPRENLLRSRATSTTGKCVWKASKSINVNYFHPLSTARTIHLFL